MINVGFIHRQFPQDVIPDHIWSKYQLTKVRKTGYIETPVFIVDNGLNFYPIIPFNFTQTPSLIQFKTTAKNVYGIWKYRPLIISYNLRSK